MLPEEFFRDACQSRLVVDPDGDQWGVSIGE
jgi:hypothetical protein